MLYFISISFLKIPKSLGSVVDLVLNPYYEIRIIRLMPSSGTIGGF